MLGLNPFPSRRALLIRSARLRPVLARNRKVGLHRARGGMRGGQPRLRYGILRIRHPAGHGKPDSRLRQSQRLRFLPAS